MSYITNFALVLASEYAKQILEVMGRDSFIKTQFMSPDQVLTDNLGDMLIISDTYHGSKMVDWFMDNVADEFEDYYRLRVFGEQMNDHEDYGAYADDTFCVFIQRNWHVDRVGKKKLGDVPWPSNLTRMAEAINDHG